MQEQRQAAGCALHCRQSEEWALGPCSAKDIRWKTDGAERWGCGGTLALSKGNLPTGTADMLLRHTFSIDKRKIHPVF